MRLAHQFAMESERVTADMVEATEFPQLAMRYGVMAVPKTVVNGRSAVDGRLPEASYLEAILAAADQTST